MRLPAAMQSMMSTALALVSHKDMIIFRLKVRCMKELTLPTTPGWEQLISGNDALLLSQDGVSMLSG